jgi:hypothetical protein
MELEFATSHRDSFKTGLNRMALRRGRPSWFLPAMAAASCRLRKSGSLKPLIYSALASNAEDLPVYVCTQFRQRTRQPTSVASMGLPISSIAKHRPSINTGKE